MKRVGHIYEKMADWDTIKEAEKISTKRKMLNCGVKRHIEHRIRNLVYIQQKILDGTMRTSEYTHEQRVSGQDKMRDIAKLKFHPSHIQHQLLTMVANERIDKSLIRHTYASRKGYGQIACALHIKDVLRKYRGQVRWYAQGDICKYYDSIPHDDLRNNLEHLFKDEKFVNAFMEPFEVFSEDGRSIPLGIRPSQTAGNAELSPFDHHMLEKVKAIDYTRYLDDFFFTGATKGEVKRKMKQAEKFLNEHGFTLHVPKIHRVSEGVDMMGYVFYGEKDDMWWRRKNKRRWLKRRSKVTNPKRLRELDDAAWGALKWGNRSCKKLWETKTGRVQKKEQRRRDMAIKLSNSKMVRTERVDKNGVPYLDEPLVSMSMILDNLIECDKWVKNFQTSQGTGRYALRIKYLDKWYKLIVNAIDIKNLISDFEKAGVTRFRTKFIDKGGKRYSFDEECTEIIEVHGRVVAEKDGICIFADDGSEVVFDNQEK